jgi:hypothetical protein
MPDEAVIKKILAEAGIYSWAFAPAGSETELFENDFETLLAVCQEGF